MRSATSYFKTLVRSDLRHYWPICFGYTFIWIIMLPIRLIRELPIAQDPKFTASGILYSSFLPALIMAVFFGLITAMACYSYLMNNRSVGLLHSLPAKRRTHFLAHFTAGMGMLTFGNVVVFALSVLAQISAMGSVKWGVSLMWLLIATLFCLIFFAIAIFCTMFTGWLLAVPVLYVAINFVVIATKLLIEGLFSLLYKGYAGGGSVAFADWMTPIIKLGGAIDNMDYPRAIHVMDFDGGREVINAVVIYAVAALVLLGVSYLLYCLRHSESAGDSVAFPWAKPIFRYVIALLGGLACGLGLYMLVFDGGSDESIPGLLICLLIMTVLCYFAADMLIRKSLRVFRQSWKGMVVSCAVIVALFAVLRLDLFGYERYVPQASEVENVLVNINACNYALGGGEDEELILAAIDAHEAAIAQEDTEDYAACCQFRVFYTLKNGREVSRSYNLKMEKDSPLYEAINRLANTKTVRHDTVMGKGEDLKPDDIFGGYVGLADRYCEMTPEQARTLYAALLSDATSGEGTWDVLAENNEAGRYCYIEFSLLNFNTLYVDVVPDYCTQAWAVIQSLPTEGADPFINEEYAIEP